MTEHNPPSVACDGKRVFLTWSQAEQILRRMRRKGKAQGFRGGTVYRCANCQKFHVGSIP